MKNILAYLYGDSQVESEIDDTQDAVDQILEAAEDLEPIKAKRTPLSAALKTLKVDAEGLELGPAGFSLRYSTEADYAENCAKLAEPEAMETLAQKGWVAIHQGDRAMSGEVEPEYRIRFIDITTPDPDDKTDWPAPNDKLMTDIIKKGREFATTPFERDEENPVEDVEAPDDKKAGVGKEKAGSDPEGKPKGGSKSEAAEHCRIKGCRGRVSPRCSEAGAGCGGLCDNHLDSQRDREKRTGEHSRSLDFIHKSYKTSKPPFNDSKNTVDNLLPPVNEIQQEARKNPEDDVWECPGCGGLNAWNQQDADTHSKRSGKEVRISTGSCFDNICGHCHTDFVRRDSPIRAEVYTHEPAKPTKGERAARRLGKFGEGFKGPKYGDMGGHYNKRKHPLCRCVKCGSKRHIEPHGTTEFCDVCNAETEHRPMTFRDGREVHLRSGGVVEGKHKAGCTCGFCKNKGRFGKKAGEPKAAKGGEEDAKGEKGDAKGNEDDGSPESGY